MPSMLALSWAAHMIVLNSVPFPSLDCFIVTGWLRAVVVSICVNAHYPLWACTEIMHGRSYQACKHAIVMFALSRCF